MHICIELIPYTKRKRPALDRVFGRNGINEVAMGVSNIVRTRDLSMMIDHYALLKSRRLQAVISTMVMQICLRYCIKDNSFVLLPTQIGPVAHD